MKPWDLIVAGGGAAGFFSAIQTAQACPGARVLLLEKSRELLAKVAISGGGRCNVTHACFDPSLLIRRYPRGGRELRGPFHRWQPSDTVEWFESHGVDLKTEADGRMFPVSDQSSDIVNCLRTQAEKAGVRIQTLSGVQRVQVHPDRIPSFEVHTTDGQTHVTRTLLLATGGNRGSGGLEVAAELGHAIEAPVPSLFTFHVQHALLEGLAGIVVDPATVSIPTLKASDEGPLLITHKGLSGPAVLKLSAWQARALADCQYRCDLAVNWLHTRTASSVQADLDGFRSSAGARLVQKHNPFGLPRRLWERMVSLAGVGAETTWGRLTREQRDTLVTLLTAAPLTMRGKTMNKEEFVTCGGIRLSEVDMKTFQSRRVPGLFFAGEVLDIDGVTGGFNFQAAWTGGALAGRAVAELISVP